MYSTSSSFLPAFLLRPQLAPRGLTIAAITETIVPRVAVGSRGLLGPSRDATDHLYWFSWARSVEVMIRLVLAVCHSLPSLKREEGSILSRDLTQYPGTEGEEGTYPVSDRKHYMMQESKAFNELWGEQVNCKCHVHIMTPMCLLHSNSAGHACEALPQIQREQGITLLSWSFHANFRLPLDSSASCSSEFSWDLNLLRKCRSHGKLLSFHEDKQDNGIGSANWISRTVWLLAEVCCLSWFSRGNTNPCIFPIITSCWNGKKTCSTNTSSL